MLGWLLLECARSVLLLLLHLRLSLRCRGVSAISVCHSTTTRRPLLAVALTGLHSSRLVLMLLRLPIACARTSCYAMSCRTVSSEVLLLRL